MSILFSNRRRQEEMHHTPPPSDAQHRPAAVLPYALVAILTYTAALWLGYTYIPSWFALPVAALPFCMALILHNVTSLGTWRYTLSVLMNATATGLAASAYFRALVLPLSPKPLTYGVGMMLLLLIAAYLLAERFDTQKRQGIIAGVSLILFFGALITLIVLWCTHPREEILYALLTFDLIFFGFYYLTFFIIATDEDNDFHRLISFWSFSLALSVAAVAGIALLIAGGGDGCDCNCDGCDCLDGCDCSPSGKKKKK